MNEDPTARDPKNTVDFGFERVAPAEKTERVRQVFESVATRYDLMNDLMSFGVHRLWKRFALSQTGLRPGMRALDLGGGTGDLALALTQQVGETGSVVLSDINAAMLEVGRGRLVDAGVSRNVEFVQANAEALPFADRSFDCVTIAFALRNVTDKDAALRSILRVLKPGGRCLVLEFSTPDPLLKPAYDLYSFKLLPMMGKLVANDADSYRYLAESIRMHPNQEALKAMMTRAGFDQVGYHNLSGGIVALHKGFKF